MRNREADEGIRVIDEFFALEAQLSEEDKLVYGLKYGVEHGILTQDEMDACLQAYHDGLTGAMPNQVDPPTTILDQ